MKDVLDKFQSEWLYLQNAWKITRNNWRDSTADGFEHHFWRLWEHEVPRTLARMKELEETLRHIKSNPDDRY